MNQDYEIKHRREAYAAFVQALKDSGAWNAIKGLAVPGQDGPLHKADLELIWQEHTFGGD